MINSPKKYKTFVFNFSTQMWNGYYTYNYDKYVSYDNKMYGIGNRHTPVYPLAQSYELNLGNIINGKPIEHFIIVPFCSNTKNGKNIETIPTEFKRIRISSSDAPTQINFYDSVIQYEAGQIQSQLFSADFKNYHNFEQWIPRRLASADTNRSRMQNRLLLAKIMYNGNNKDYKVISVGVMNKDLK